MSKRVIDLAGDAVFACLPLLPLNGSDQQGYRVTDTIGPTMRATVEEWADAAHAIAELHSALRSERDETEQDGSAERARVVWRCRACAGQAWGPELPLRLEANGRRVVVYEPECWGTETLPHGPVRMRRLDHVDGETNT